jgi:hypothetical protein
MYRMTLVVLLLAVKLPMTAGEAVGVTVHQAEWGDTRGEAPPPSGPSVPIKADDPAPIFQRTGFRYGGSLRYGNRIQYGRSFRYHPGTRVNGLRTQNRSAYRPNMTYRGVGKQMRGSYRPNIQYGSGVNSRGNFQYNFGN